VSVIFCVSLSVLFGYVRVDTVFFFFFFSSRRRHTRCYRDWSSDVCSSDLVILAPRSGASITLASPEVNSPTVPGYAGLCLNDLRSEERRVGKECRSRGWTGH